MAIAVTMGDPAGVGPELILKAFLEGSVSSEFFVVGDLDVLTACNAVLSASASRSAPPRPP